MRTTKDSTMAKNSGEEDLPTHGRNSNTLEDCLDVLFSKKGSARGRALAVVADILANTLQHKFVNDNAITLLYVCLISIKKGTKTEICLASYVIGLLSITAGREDDLAHEILEESFSPLSQALQSGVELGVISCLLDCLAIVTFVGGSGVVDTERSMKLIWKFVHPNPGSSVVASRPTPELFKTALSAWSFLLTTMEAWNDSSKFWKRSICHLTSELESDSICVNVAAGEALALIFELGSVDKFYSGSEKYASVEVLKETIIEQVKNLSIKAEDKDTVEVVLIKSHWVLFRDFSSLLKGVCCPETIVKIGRNQLKVSTWSQRIQVIFLKHFLGGGFIKHAQENILLHDFLDILPRTEKQAEESDEEDTTHYFFKPEGKTTNKFSLRKKRTIQRKPNQVFLVINEDAQNAEISRKQGKNKNDEKEARKVSRQEYWSICSNHGK